MSDEPDPSRYQLSDEDNELIFREDIIPTEIAPAEPMDRPVIVFVIAQQGSGKTRASAQAAVEIDPSAGFVNIDSDIYKSYHPLYAELLSRDDRFMALYTREDARAWTRKVQDYVREHRLNGVVQEVGGNPPYNAGVLTSFQATHVLDAMFLGVSEAMSRQGILSRYHQQVHDRGRGRLTPDGNHARAYEGIPELARLIDDGHLVDRVRVFRRGEGSPRYQNYLTPDGDWASPPDLAGAVEAERDRRWTPLESALFLRDHQTLVAGLASDQWGEDVTSVLRRHAPQQLSTPRPDAGIGTDFHPELAAILELGIPLIHPDLRDSVTRLVERLGLPEPRVVVRAELAEPSVAGSRPTVDAAPHGTTPSLAIENVPARDQPMGDGIGDYVAGCQEYLWSDQAAPLLRWLTTRGLDPDILLANRVGADPGTTRLPRPQGLPRTGFGIVIPALDDRQSPTLLEVWTPGETQPVRYLAPGDGARPPVAEVRVLAASYVPDDTIVVCSDLLDALTTAQHGYRSAALLEPADLATARWISQRHPTEQIVVCLSGDDQGHLHGALRQTGAGDRTVLVPLSAGVSSISAWRQAAGPAFTQEFDAAVGGPTDRQPPVTRVAAGDRAPDISSPPD